MRARNDMVYPHSGSSSGRVEHDARSGPPAVRPRTHSQWRFRCLTPFWSAGLAAGCLLSGCSFAPKYQRPDVQTTAAFKELTNESPDAITIWKVAQPSDAVLRGKW